jgi:hypothetical protein
MSKVRGNVFSHEQDAAEDLIAGCVASGAKLAGTVIRRLYGTGEVVTVAITDEGSADPGMGSGNGGGPGRSSEEDSERRRSEGTGLFRFQDKRQPKKG